MNFKKIPDIIYPRDNYFIKNKFEFESYNLDLNIIIYYLEINKVQIIIRRLDQESGWDEQISIKLFNIDMNEHEIIECGSSNFIEKKFNIETETKILKKFYKNTSIPKYIYQTYENNNYQNFLHYNSVQSFLDFNPDYTYEFFDDKKCDKFIRENFENNIYDSYRKLYPSAYKADLFRYCLIYKKGGCYFDNKYIPRISLGELIDENDNDIFCLDTIEDLMFNSLIISIPNKQFFLDMINNIVYNVRNKYYGVCPLDPTGPRLFYKYTKDKNIKFKHVVEKPKKDYKNSKIVLLNTNKTVFNTHYKGYYYNKNHRNKEKNDYTKCWKNKKIYN